MPTWGNIASYDKAPMGAYSGDYGITSIIKVSRDGSAKRARTSLEAVRKIAVKVHLHLIFK